MKACVELKRRYPDQMDWIFRTAEVHEAKGDLGAAIAQGPGKRLLDK